MKASREKVHQKYCGKCGYCGEEIAIKEMQIDHIEPIYRNHSNSELSAMNVIRGTNDFENLMPSCKSCNNYKKTLTVEKFRIEMQKQVQRCNNYSTNYRFAKKFGLIEETNLAVIFFFEK
jgi:5-methylcytosine-specific restriction endonuclease McrA